MSELIFSDSSFPTLTVKYAWKCIKECEAILLLGMSSNNWWDWPMRKSQQSKPRWCPGQNIAGKKHWTSRPDLPFHRWDAPHSWPVVTLQAWSCACWLTAEQMKSRACISGWLRAVVHRSLPLNLNVRIQQPLGSWSLGLELSHLVCGQQCATPHSKVE